METTSSQSPQESGRAPAAFSRESLLEAIRFWEPRRLVYNLILAGFVTAWVLGSWPHFRPAMTLDSLLFLVIMALLANLCYCAAYLAEMLIQNSASRASRNFQRWGVWAIGTLLAMLFENYWIADEIYPFVQGPFAK